jgi:hypothetical protein
LTGGTDGTGSPGGVGRLLLPFEIAYLEILANEDRARVAGFAVGPGLQFFLDGDIFISRKEVR